MQALGGQQGPPPVTGGGGYRSDFDLMGMYGSSQPTTQHYSHGQVHDGLGAHAVNTPAPDPALEKKRELEALLAQQKVDISISYFFTFMIDIL